MNTDKLRAQHRINNRLTCNACSISYESDDGLSADSSFTALRN